MFRNLSIKGEYKLEDINILIRNFIDDYSWLISLCGAIIAILMNIMIKRNEMKMNSEYEKKLEEVKFELVRKEQIFNASLGAISNSNEFYYERSALAVEVLWSCIQEIIKTTSHMSLVYSILLPEEYDNYISRYEVKNAIISEDDFNKRVISLDDRINEVRPFLDVETWNKFFLFRAYKFRCMHLFLKGVKDGKVLPWYEDRHLVEMFESFMGTYKIKNYKEIGMFGQITTYMETIIINEIQRVLKGHKLSDELLKRSMEISSIDINAENRSDLNLTHGVLKSIASGRIK
jgi:hypothetical protein